jgi:drug/metabolite transporter (DMT)-like permease
VNKVRQGDFMKNILVPFSLLILAQFIWAISWLIIKKLFDVIPSVVLYVAEAIIMFLIIVPLIFYFYKEIAEIKKGELFLIAISGIFTVAATIIYYIGFKKTPYIFASLTFLTFPLFVVLIGIIFFKRVINSKVFHRRRPNDRRIFGVSVVNSG